MDFTKTENQNSYGSTGHAYSPQSHFQYQQSNIAPQHQPSSPMTIKNQSTGQLPKVKGPEMNDRDRLNDILATEKYLTDSFNVLVREASHQALFNDVMTILNDTHHQARDLFNMMFAKGWYKLEAESEQQVSQTHQQFTNYKSQFPSGGQGFA